MKCTAVAVAAFAAIVAAQTAPPECAVVCATVALERAGCPGFSDVGCACAPATRAALEADSELTLCVNASCSTDEIAIAIAAADDACKEFPPACAVPCISAAFKRAGCLGLNDTECFCAPAAQAVLAADSELIICMNSSCSPDEIEAAIRAGDATCKGFGGDFFTTATESAETSETSSAGDAKETAAGTSDAMPTSEGTAPPEVTTAAGATHSLFGGAALLAAVLAL